MKKKNLIFLRRYYWHSFETSLINPKLRILGLLIKRKRKYIRTLGVRVAARGWRILGTIVQVTTTLPLKNGCSRLLLETDILITF